MSKKAIYLLGGPGSGKDFLLRTTILKEIREIHLSKLNENICNLSDSVVLVNANADAIREIERSVRTLAEQGYETFGVYVYTTDVVSRQRNEQRRNRGSRTIDEAIRKSKYEMAKGALLVSYPRLFDQFVIFDNSSANVITEEVQGWLKELQVEIASFLLENAGGNSPTNIMDGQTLDGHDEHHGIGRTKVRTSAKKATGGGEPGASFAKEEVIEEGSNGRWDAYRVFKRRLRKAQEHHNNMKKEHKKRTGEKLKEKGGKHIKEDAYNPISQSPTSHSSEYESNSKEIGTNGDPNNTIKTTPSAGIASSKQKTTTPKKVGVVETIWVNHSRPNPLSTVHPQSKNTQGGDTGAGAGTMGGYNAETASATVNAAGTNMSPVLQQPQKKQQAKEPGEESDARVTDGMANVGTIVPTEEVNLVPAKKKNTIPARQMPSTPSGVTSSPAEMLSMNNMTESRVIRKNFSSKLTERFIRKVNKTKTLSEAKR